MRRPPAARGVALDSFLLCVSGAPEGLHSDRLTVAFHIKVGPTRTRWLEYFTASHSEEKSSVDCRPPVTIVGERAKLERGEIQTGIKNP